MIAQNGRLEWDGFGWSLEQEPEGVDNSEDGATISAMGHFDKRNYYNYGHSHAVSAQMDRGVDIPEKDTKLPSMGKPDNYADLMVFMTDYVRTHPEQRRGQAFFNALSESRWPELADQIRATPLDPFYNDAILEAFFEYLMAEMPS